VTSRPSHADEGAASTTKSREAGILSALAGDALKTGDDNGVTFTETGDDFDLGVGAESGFDGEHDLLAVAEDLNERLIVLGGDGGDGKFENRLLSIEDNFGGDGHVGEDLVGSGVKFDQDAVLSDAVGDRADAIDAGDGTGEAGVGKAVEDEGGFLADLDLVDVDFSDLETGDGKAPSFNSSDGLVDGTATGVGGTRNGEALG